MTFGKKQHEKDKMQQEMFKAAFKKAQKEPFFAGMPRHELMKVIRTNVEQMMKDEELKNKHIKGEN